MKPEQFIREYGVEKARELLSADSDFKTYCLIDKSFWGESEGTCSFCVDLDGLKRLVESLERINKCGGLYGFKTYCNGDYSQEDLQAIRDHESIYGGGDE
ncbi:hypothetical protein [Acinetobacter nosocomialis]|uniref:hypothetical protein n=1 Tax=Acinetobacter nosocomialis TaxID=106654 RepID=UPI00374F6B19